VPGWQERDFLYRDRKGGWLFSNAPRTWESSWAIKKTCTEEKLKTYRRRGK